ncbi:MAG: GtrA family protein [Planctomycetota bacterium]|nr:GtrA family protein [Planctomycetota bacterium]
MGESDNAKPTSTGRVSLVCFSQMDVDPESPCQALVERLRALGWDVEFRVVSVKPSDRSFVIESFLPELQSEFLILVDSDFELHMDWFQSALSRILDRDADIVVSIGTPRDMIGKVAAKLVGRLTGCQSVNAAALVACRSAIADRPVTLRPAGRWFSLEMQLRIPRDRCSLSGIYSPVRLRRIKGMRIGHPELSFLKSSIDHKYGNASRLIQFCAVGFSGMIVDLTLYACFQFQALFLGSVVSEVKVPLIGGSGDLALAGFLAVWLAMSWNFLINRRFTFNDARRNSSILRQYLTYATGNALAIGVSLVIRLWLPTQMVFFNDHKLAAAFVGIVLATGISFSMARYFVFKSPATT